jgi:filamentous hemagglutinin
LKTASISSASSRANESAHRPQAQLSRDTLVQASTLVADGDISVKAGRNLTVTTAQNTQAEQNQTTAKTSGLLRLEGSGKASASASRCRRSKARR